MNTIHTFNASLNARLNYIYWKKLFQTKLKRLLSIVLKKSVFRENEKGLRESRASNQELQTMTQQR